MIDLQKFCLREDEGRPYFQRPFSVGAFSYATNGHVLVRVDHIDGVADLAACIASEKIESVLAGVEAAVFDIRPPRLPPDGVDDAACAFCDGRGLKHACPDCACECEHCGSTGTRGGFASIDVGGGPFRVGYLRWVLALPGVALADATPLPADPAAPRIFFRFDGGVGTLNGMPRRRKSHFDINGQRVVSA